MRLLLAALLAVPALALPASAAGCMEEVRGLCVYDVRDAVCTRTDLCPQ